MMERSDERLKELMKSLADTIGQVINGNEEIRNKLAKIEEEGYSVDMIVTSITGVLGKGDISSDTDEQTGITDFDRSFLKKIHIRL